MKDKSMFCSTLCGILALCFALIASTGPLWVQLKVSDVGAQGDSFQGHVGSGLYCAGFTYSMFGYANTDTASCRGTVAPTLAPTGTAAPTLAPTGTAAPTLAPTGTAAPTLAPTGTAAPTLAPTGTTAPTFSPTFAPTSSTKNETDKATLLQLGSNKSDDDENNNNKNETAAPTTTPAPTAEKKNNNTAAPTAEPTALDTQSLLKPCGDYIIYSQCYSWSEYVKDLNEMDACQDAATFPFLNGVCDGGTAKVPSAVVAGRVLVGISVFLLIVNAILGCCSGGGYNCCFDEKKMDDDDSLDSLDSREKLQLWLVFLGLGLVTCLLLMVTFIVYPNSSFTTSVRDAHAYIPLKAYAGPVIGFLPSSPDVTSYGISFAALILTFIASVCTVAFMLNSFRNQRQHKLTRTKDSNMIFIYGDSTENEPLLVRPDLVI